MMSLNHTSSLRLSNKIDNKIEKIEKINIF